MFWHLGLDAASTEHRDEIAGAGFHPLAHVAQDPVGFAGELVVLALGIERA